MLKYLLFIEYFTAPPGGPQNLQPILIDAADDAEAERQAQAVATFAMDSMVIHQIKVTITTQANQVINTIQRP